MNFFYPKVHKVYEVLDKLKSFLKIPASRYADLLVKRKVRLKKVRDIRLEYDSGEIILFYLAN